ncbi:MAG TPA: peptidoglycan DD-metalloendopeptidase family protein, partial [Thermomicrobiales bacterium]|nr:peptidoglycan DD-metalloendopeptidase family protein [Thermomicrobiales bacterium]
HAGPDRDTGLANSQIIIQSDGANRDYGTEYLHWQAAYVREGDYVRAGQPIAEVGSVGYSTGPHLHFSVIDYRTDERIDPMSWLPKDKSTGGYLGLEPNAKRFPIASKSKPLPDYADPAPPPPPAQERVPKHDAKKAAKHAGGKHGGGRHRKQQRDANADAGTDAGNGKKHHNGNRRAAEATATPAPEATDKPRHRRADRANEDDGGNRGQASNKKRDRGDAAPPSDNDKNGNDQSDRRHRSDDGGDAAPLPEPTATPAPTGPGTNLPPPVPPVPGVPAPLVPGAAAAQPQPTAAPESGKRRGSSHEKRQKQKQKKQKADGG